MISSSSYLTYPFSLFPSCRVGAAQPCTTTTPLTRHDLKRAGLRTHRAVRLLLVACPHCVSVSSTFSLYSFFFVVLLFSVLLFVVVASPHVDRIGFLFFFLFLLHLSGSGWSARTVNKHTETKTTETNNTQRQQEKENEQGQAEGNRWSRFMESFVFRSRNRHCLFHRKHGNFMLPSSRGINN